MLIRLILLPLLTGLCFCCLAQNLTNLSAVQQGNEVVVTYHLDGEKGKAYTVTLYASNDNFAAPLRLVQGDVAAKRVLPGSNKTIKWRVLDELKTFDGEISFEIRAVPAIPLFSKIMSSAAKVKRGKEITITWAGGLPKEQVTVELVSGDQTVPASITDNNGRLLFSVPKKMKTGTYTIHLSQAGEITTGNVVAVQPRIPLLLKVLPVVVVGSVIALLPKSPSEFPEPPDLTGN